jgi:hypothetical protein
MARELTPEEIDALSNIVRTRKTRAKFDPNDALNRNIKVWFDLDMRFGLCGNDDCPDDRPLRVAEGNAMVAVVGLHSMCRLCFLAGFGLDNSGEGV